MLLGLALDASGALYVCDPGNHTVWRYDHENAPTRYGPFINYPNYASFAPDGTLYVSDSGSFVVATGSIVAISPDGSSRVLDLPPVDFANGLSVYEGYLYYVASALPGVWRVSIAEGANVRGYFWWTLTDNYEWNHGMTENFGLYAVDPATKTRTLRPLGQTYAKIVAARQVTGDLVSQYPIEVGGQPAQ